MRTGNARFDAELFRGRWLFEVKCSTCNYKWETRTFNVYLLPGASVMRDVTDGENRVAAVYKI